MRRSRRREGRPELMPVPGQRRMEPMQAVALAAQMDRLIRQGWTDEEIDRMLQKILKTVRTAHQFTSEDVRNEIALRLREFFTP